MKASQRARACVEVLVVVICIFVALGFLLPWLARRPENARISRCKANLQEVGKAMAAYREDNGGYFPFSWQRAGEPEPTGTSAANAAMAATSLGNLYPRYLLNPQLFHCPSVEDQPSFVLNLPLEYRGTNTITFRIPPMGSNWTLTGNQPLNRCDPKSTAIRASSYGYDPRISPRGADRLVVAADMDGKWWPAADTSGAVLSNHYGGQNVLYVDGHVAWKSDNYCSRDPNDNIFVEDKWDADTDTYLVDTNAVSLGASFDGYNHLHYPQTPKP